MKNVFIKSYLFVAGLVMLLVGIYIAITTMEYMAAISPTNDMTSINLLSDLRGMGGVLLVLGTYVFISTFYAAWQWPALIIATAIYASFGIFRSLSLALDGMPETEIMIAYLIEVVMAMLGVWLIEKGRLGTLLKN